MESGKYVLGLVGSPNRDGRTSKLVSAALEGARQKGSPTQLIQLADRAFYKNDHIEKHVSPETYLLINKETKTLGMQIELIRMQKPWFLALSFQAMELMRLGYEPQHGVDYHFLSRARGKKRILELESLDEQLSLLSEFSD
jgi:hypothetical protein